MRWAGVLPPHHGPIKLVRVARSSGEALWGQRRAGKAVLSLRFKMHLQIRAFYKAHQSYNP